MEYHLAKIQRNEGLIYAATWMNLKNIISQQSQTQRLHMLLSHFYELSGIVTIQRQEADQWMSESGGKREKKVTGIEF